MAKVKVAVLGTVGRVVFLETDATIGAKLGTDLFTPDGEVGTPATVRAWLGLSSGVAETPAGGSNHHRLLQGLTLGNDHPQYPLKAGTETISGQWNFTQQVRAADGSAGAPSYSWEGDRTNGIYRIGAHNFGLATNGVLRWDINTARTFQTLYHMVRNPSGIIVDNPDSPGAGIEITANNLYPDTSTDAEIWFREVANQDAGFRIQLDGNDAFATLNGFLKFWAHNFSVLGTEALRINRNPAQVQFPDGTAGVPSFGRLVTTGGNTGLYFPTTASIGFTVGGTQRLQISATEVSSTIPLQGGGGSESTPAIAFTTGPATGFFRPTTDSLAVSVGGTRRFSIGSTDAAGSALGDGVRSTLSFRGPAGSLTVPTFTFTGDDNTGMYNVGADQLGLVTGGARRMLIANSLITFDVQASHSVAPLFANTLTPAQITSNQDNYSPANLASAVHLRLSTDASRTISGLATGANGRFLVITNVGASNIVFLHQNTGSSEANRFLFDDGGSLTLTAEETRIFWYDTTTARWRTLVGGGGGAGGVVDSVVAGTGISVDDSDVNNPIVAVDINGLTADASPVGSTDYVMTYDASASTLKKVLLDDLPGGGGGGGTVDSIVEGGGIQVDATDPANPIVSAGGSAAELEAEILADSPLGYWKLDEASGNFADSSGNGRTMTAVGSPTYQYCALIPGETTKYVYFDTNGDGATRSDSCGLSMPANADWTFECIMLVQTAVVTGPFGIGGANETEAQNYQVRPRFVATTRVMGAYWENGAGGDNNINGVIGKSRIDVAQHYAWVKDGTADTVSLYINGQLVDTVSYANEPTGGSNVTSQLGANDVSGTTQGTFALAHAALYSTALSASRILAHARAAGFV